jgi:putative phage-type endonuclease
MMETSISPMIPAQNFPTESDWLDARSNWIGASESAAILGHGYEGQSPLTIWSSKTGGPKLPIEPSLLRLMERGKKMEPIIADEFASETGLPIRDPGRYAVYIHPEHPWMAATLDRWVIHPEHGPIPGELKNIHGRNWRDWDLDSGTDVQMEPPLKYWVQCQHQMEVTGTDYCYLIAWIGGADLRHVLIKRDRHFCGLMVYQLAQFWGHVQARTMPPLDGSEATRKILGKIYPNDSGDAVSLPEEFGELDRQLLKIKDLLKVLQEKKELLENRIRAAIGEATEGILPFGGKYTWKPQQRRGVDLDLLRSRYPGIATECEKMSDPFRVLRRSK